MRFSSFFNICIIIKTWKELKRRGLDKYIEDNYKARISRLEQIQAQIYSKIKMIAYKENKTATEMYKGIINDSYYKTMFDIQQGFNQDNVDYKDWLKGINTLKNKPKSSIINMHIDKMTPCLYKKETNEYIDTFFKKMSNKEELKELTKDWKFNWNKEDNVYGLHTKDNKDRLQGLISYKVQKENQAVYIKLLENSPDNIQNKTYTGVGGHMIAQACKISFNHGYDGFVYLDAKTNLINHYKKYGAKQFAKSQKMIFDENASKKLVEEYYGKKKRH